MMHSRETTQHGGSRRVLRRVVQGFAALLVGLTLLIAGALAYSQTAAFHHWLREQVVSRANASLNGQVKIGGLEGGLLGGLDVTDVEVTMEGAELIAVKRLTASYNLLALITHRRLVLNRVTIDGLRARLVQDERGWNAARLVPPSATVQGEEMQAGPAVGVRLADFTVRDGAVDVVRSAGNYTLRELMLHASGSVDRKSQRVQLETLSFVMPERDIRVEQIAADVQVDADGKIQAENVIVKTAASSVRAQIAVGGQEYDAHADIERLSADEVHRLTGGAVPATDVSAALRARGPARAISLDGTALNSAAGRVSIAGVVDLSGEPYGYDLRVGLEHLDAAGLLGPTQPKTSLTGTLKARGKGTTLDAAAAFDVALDDSSIRDTRFERLAMHGNIENQQITLNAVAKTNAGDAAVAGTVNVRNEHYDLRLKATQFDPTPFLNRNDLTARINGTLNVQGSGFKLQTARADAQLAVGPSRVESIEIRKFDGALRMAESRLTVERLNLESNVGRVEASGTTDVQGMIDRNHAAATSGRLRFAVQVTDLRPLARLSSSGPVAGVFTLNGTASGRLDALDVDATFDGKHLLAKGTRIDGLHAQVAGQAIGTPHAAANVTAQAKEILTGGRRLALARIEIGWKGTGAAQSAATVDLVVRQDEKHEHTVRASAELTPQETRVSLRTLILKLGNDTWQNTEVAQVRRHGDRVAISNFDLRSDRGQITLEGEGGTAGDENVTLTVREIDLAPLVAGQPGDVTGRVSAHARLTGSAKAPQIEAEIAIDQPAIEKVRYQSVHGDLHLVRGQAAAHVRVVQSGESQLMLEAQLPVEVSLSPFRFQMGESVSGTLRAKNVDVAFLEPILTQVSELRGTVAADLSLSGSVRQPDIRGPLSVTAAHAYVLPVGVRYDPIDVRVRFEGSSCQIETLRLGSGRGWLNGTGTAQLGQDGVAGSMNLQLHEFPLFDNQYGEGRTSGWLWLGGSTRAPIIEGAVETDRLVFRIPEKLPSPARPPDPTISVVGPGASESLAPPAAALPAAQQAPQTEASPILTPQASIHIQVDVPHNAWLRRSDADIELRGWINIWKKPKDPLRVAGDIETVRGWYTFEGRKFTVSEGQVTLTGQDFDPLLKVVAVHQAGDYTVRINIGGKLTKPTIKLESDPSMEQADILAVLLFGKPANKLNQGESKGLRQQALGVASGYVASEFRQSVAGALGIDTLEVEPNPPAGLGGTGVTMGKYISEDVFVSLSHKFAQQNIEELIVQYFFTSHWTLEASTDTQGKSAVDLFWKRQY